MGRWWPWRFRPEVEERADRWGRRSHLSAKGEREGGKTDLRGKGELSGLSTQGRRGEAGLREREGVRGPREGKRALGRKRPKDNEGDFNLFFFLFNGFNELYAIKITS